MKFALIGHPVAHSLSPVIHHAAYRELGLSHSYGLIDAATEADVERVAREVRSGELSGVNVTIPWKRKAFALAERHSSLAQRLGVANVLSREGDALVAHNTDALALQTEFRRLVQGTRAIVLGSGGAVPAVVAACHAAGITDVQVTARRYSPETAPAAWPGAADLNALGAKLLAWPEAGGEARARFVESAEGASLIVQCTSAGMQGADSGEPLARLVPWSALPEHALAYDLIYAPLETPFLRAARESGRRALHGLHMLVGQAQLAIEIWLGQLPSAEPMLQAALDELARRGRP